MPDTSRVLSPDYRWTTIGMLSLIVIVAFENLAVTTVMPLISDQFDGAELYALAFGGPLAISVIGMVISGNWSDRAGPVGPMLASVAVFNLGLLVAGAATSMETLIVGRLLHGLGGGGINVALYVMVAKAYPSRLHPAIFSGFAAGWLIPAIVGPFIGGFIAQYVGWRWVFFGVVLLSVPALAAVAPAMRQLRKKQFANPVPWSLRRLLVAVIVATGVLSMDMLTVSGGRIGWVVGIGAGVMTVVALRSLLPAGTYRLRAGLPAVIGMRGILGSAFIAVEVYLPYLLTDVYHVSPTLTGASLTAAGITWVSAAEVHNRLSHRLTPRRILLVGSALLSVSATLVTVGALLDVGPVPIIASWAVAGAGMGFSFPRLGTMTLALSTASDSGFNSAALSIADAIGSAIVLTIAGIAFVAGGGPALMSGFVAVFAITTVLAYLSVFAGWRASSTPVPGVLP